MCRVEKGRGREGDSALEVDGEGRVLVYRERERESLRIPNAAVKRTGDQTDFSTVMVTACMQFVSAQFDRSRLFPEYCHFILVPREMVQRLGNGVPLPVRKNLTVRRRSSWAMASRV